MQVKLHYTELLKMKKYVNGILADMTDAEIKELNDIRAVGAAHEKTVDDARAVTKLNRTSGKAKLKSLGLSDDEITALVGGNP